MTAGPCCARCGQQILAGAVAHSGRLVALDQSFIALFELCDECYRRVIPGGAEWLELHERLREHLQQLFLLTGDPGGRA